MFSISVCRAIGLLPLLCTSAAGQIAGPTPEALAARLVALSDRERALELSRPESATADVARALIALGDEARLDAEFSRALLAFRTAESAARRAGAEAEIGIALNGIADSLFRITELDRALAAAEESARFHEMRKDANGLGEAWNTIANVYFYRGEHPQALEAGRKVLELWSSSGNRRGVGRVLNNIGNIHKALGNLDEAAAHYDEALRIFEELGDRRSSAVVTIGIGRVYYGRGEYKQAVASLERGLAMSEDLDDRVSIAAILDTLGNVYGDQGAYSRALGALHRSLEIRRTTGDKYAIAESENNIGLVHFSQGDYPLAIDAFKRGLRVSAEAGVSKGLAPEALFNIGRAAWRLGETTRARANFQEALALAERDGFKSLSAANLHALGQMALEAGRPGEAEELFQRALGIREEMKDQGGIAQSLNGLATQRLATGRFREAVDLAAQSTDIARRFEQLEWLWEAETLSGIAKRRLGDAEAARSDLLEAIAVVERLREQVAGPALGRERFFETKLSPYHELLDVAFASGRPVEALEIAERAKGRVLAEMVQRAPVDVALGMTKEERSEERRLRAALRSLNGQVLAERTKPSPDEGRLEALEAQRSTKRSEYEAVQIALYARHPELRVQRGEAAPFAFSDAGALVPDDSVAVLEYVVADEAAYLFAVTRADGVPRVDSFRLNVGRELLASRVRRFRERLASRDLLYGEEARALYDLVLAPAHAALAGKTHLVIVPDGPLWEASFQALQDEGGRHLVESAAVSYAPSLTVLRESLREVPRQTGPPTLLAMGKTDFGSKDLAPLPEAERQVRELRTLYGVERSAIYLGPEATEERFKAEAPRHRIVHIASHGFLDESSPFYSNVVFSPPSAGASEDGLLEAWELLDLKLGAELVILSACESGRGRVAPGEGIIGTMWALFVAGSKATVVSQWRVESVSTTELMTAFHQGLARGDGGKADLLRRATLELLRNPRYAHPFYWAPFVLVGNPF
jgi:CHAT domain-containing protein/Tfp pilus assembly protein PilF